jgi:hypothetical protein
MRCFEHAIIIRRDVITGGWRTLHNEELHNMYSSLNIINDQVKENEMSRTCSTHGAEEECIYISGRKAGKYKPLGRSTHRWDDNIKMNFREIGWE